MLCLVKFVNVVLQADNIDKSVFPPAPFQQDYLDNHSSSRNHNWSPEFTIAP